MNDLAREIIAELEPESGWWKSDTEDCLVEAALAMLEHMDAETVQDTIESIVNAISAEYGD